MRILPELLKLAGALVIAGILRHPETFPPPGAGRYVFLGTFAWPLLFVPLLFWVRGPIATGLRLLEVLLILWTTFMVVFAAGMNPGLLTFGLVAGAVTYGIGAAWSSLLALKSTETVARGSP
jgi:hypothetical protein